MRWAVNQFFFILKTEYLHLKISYKDESACLWKQHKGNKFPFMVTDCVGKIFTGLHSADSVSEKFT